MKVLQIQQHNLDCYCDNGYQGNGRNDCEDIDECSDVLICGFGTCVNTLGSYHCYCPPGLIGPNCNETRDYCDIKPCANGGTCISQPSNYICV